MEQLCHRLGLLQSIAAMRGRVARAITLSDSANMMPGCGDRPGHPRRWPGSRTILLALADPGYGSAPDRFARELAAYADTSSDAEAVCHAALWRVSRGDTLRALRAIEQIPRLIRPNIHPLPVGVGSLGVCVRLLEAAVEDVRAASGPVPALLRLDSLMRQGVILEEPSNIANLVLARRLAARGDLRGALAAARRRVYNYNLWFAMLLPAYLREEGRLAAITGDTAGAIRAYQHYLRLRDRPDAGPMAEEVRQVRAHLADLVEERRGRQET